MLISAVLLCSVVLGAAADSPRNTFLNRYERQAHVDTVAPTVVTTSPAPTSPAPTSPVPTPTFSTTPCQPTNTCQPIVAGTGEGKCSTSFEKLWMDIVVLVDNSRAMRREIGAVAGLLNSLFSKITFDRDTPKHSRIALLTYNRKVATIGAFDKYGSAKDLFRDLFSLRASNEPTVDLSTAFQEAQRLFGRTKDRPNVQRAVLVVAAEYDYSGLNDPKKAALQLKESGISIITIAHTSAVGGQLALELSNVASPNMSFANNHASVYDSLKKAFCYVNCFCKANWQTYKPPFDENAKEFYGECLYPVVAAADRESAEAVCPLEEAHLIHVKTTTKQDTVLSIVRMLKDVEAFHIGLRRESGGSPWKWSGEEQEANKEVLQMLLSGGNSGDCGVGVLSNGTVLYENRSCEQGEYSYICQSKICDTENYCDMDDAAVFF